MTARAIVVLGALAWLPGCMVGPDYRRPDVATPAAWGELAPLDGARTTSRVDEGTVVTAWWEGFDDPVLTSLVLRALQANFDVARAEARVREARASRKIAYSELWPHAEATGSYARERTSANGIAPGTRRGSWFNLFQVGFDASWELDVFGGIRRSIEASTANLEAAEADRDAVLLSLSAEVGLEYVTYRSLQQRVALATQNLDAQQATLDLTQRLFKAGLAPELDVTRAQAQVSTTAATIPLLRAQAAQSVHRLGTLIGQLPMTLTDELRPEGDIPQAPRLVSVGLPSELLLRRPDVARSERQLAAATADIGVATRDLFPRFFLTGMGGLQSLKASDLFDWQSRIASLGPSISWSIFQGGAIRANIALQTATQEELLAAYRAAVLQAFQDVEDALSGFSNDQLSRDQLSTAVGANDRAAELARRLYGQGLTDFLNVLDAQRTLFESQDALAQSQRDVALDLVSLYKAVGGGWEVASASP